MLFVPPMLDVMDFNKLDKHIQLMHPIDLRDWDDVITDALQNVSLYHLNELPRPDTPISLYPTHFTLEFATPTIRAAIEMAVLSPDKQKELVNAVYSATQHFVKAFLDYELIQAYIETEKLDYFLNKK